MNESLQLLRTSNILYMALYAAGSLFIGIIAVFIGIQLVKQF
jgi:CrcB protein